MSQAAPTHAGHVPSPDLVARVSALVAKIGMARAVEDLGIGREALARLAGGLPVRAGTIALAAQSLASLTPATSRPRRVARGKR